MNVMTCESCLHWKQLNHWQEKSSEVNFCHRISHLSSAVPPPSKDDAAYVITALHNGLGALITKPSFGCILHTPKE